MNYKSSFASMLVAVVQLHPLSSLAASYRSEPNPVGEKAYAAHSLTLLLPVGIIACGLLSVWLVSRISAKARKPAAGDSESHHC